MTPVLTQQNMSVIAFRLDHRTFALPLEVIVQILPMMTITHIPHLSGIVKGTINVRGESILVISLRSHFGLLEEPLQLYTPLLLLKVRDRSLALIVDQVLDVMTLSLEQVTSLQTILPDGIENIPMLHGISYHNNETVLVLDPDHLFYNQQPVTQVIDPTITPSFIQSMEKMFEQTPAQNIVETETSVEEKKPVVKKIPAVKRIPVAKRKPVVAMEESAPVAEDTLVEGGAPVVENTPVEEAAPDPTLSSEQFPSQDE